MIRGYNGCNFRVTLPIRRGTYSIVEYPYPERIRTASRSPNFKSYPRVRRVGYGRMAIQYYGHGTEIPTLFHTLLLSESNSDV